MTVSPKDEANLVLGWKNHLQLVKRNANEKLVFIPNKLLIIEARFGWRQNIWDDVPCSHANGMKDVTEICTRNIVNNELHLNPDRKGQVFNQLFWPETASGPAIARKVGIRYTYGSQQFQLTTAAVGNETVCVHITSK